MTDKRWEFELDQARHSVELEHNTFSNKRSIRVDGRLLSLAPESQQPQERGGKHAFRINGHACEVRINYQDRKFAYDLLVDGVSNTPEKYTIELAEVQTSDEAKAQRRAMVILFLGIGLGGNCLNWTLAHTLGWYIGELAFITATVAVFGFYFLLFPKKFNDHYVGKSNLLLVIVLILAFLIGYANYYAFEHGLY